MSRTSVAEVCLLILADNRGIATYLLVCIAPGLAYSGQGILVFAFVQYCRWTVRSNQQPYRLCTQQRYGWHWQIDFSGLFFSTIPSVHHGHNQNRLYCGLLSVIPVP